MKLSLATSLLAAIFGVFQCSTASVISEQKPLVSELVDDAKRADGLHSEEQYPIGDSSFTLCEGSRTDSLLHIDSIQVDIPRATIGQ